MTRSRLISSLLTLLLILGLVGLVLIVGFVVTTFSRKADREELERTTVSTVTVQKSLSVGTNVTTEVTTHISVEHVAKPMPAGVLVPPGTNADNQESNTQPSADISGVSVKIPLYHVTNPVTPVAPPPIEAGRTEPPLVPPGTGRTGNPGP